MHFAFNPVASGSAVALLLMAVAPQSTTAQRMYTKNSPVLQIDAKSWDKLIVNSHLPSNPESSAVSDSWTEALQQLSSSPVETPFSFGQMLAKLKHKSKLTNALSPRFYAPWCGHCQNLKPAYEKAAGSLSGIVQIAAVNCDEDSNKPLCGQLGIQGFPTLKTVRPASLLASSKPGKKGKPAISDYKGPRSARDIAEAARGLLPNLVTKVTDADLSSWLAKDNDTAKALLFTDKGTTSALLKSLALDFKPSLRIGQARGDREDKATDMFGADKFPTFVVLPGGDKAAVTYDGEMNKADMFAFLKIYAEPVSAASAGTKSSGSSGDASGKGKSKSSSNKKAGSKAKPAAASETLEDDASESSPQPTMDDVPKPATVPVDAPPPLRTLSTPEELSSTCLGPKTGTCVLALLPSSSSSSDDSGADPDLSPAALEAISSLTQLSAKLHASNANVFPFYVVSAAAGARLRKGLGLEEGDGEEAGAGKVTLLAVNGKRRWVRRHEPAGEEKGFGVQALQAWVDGVKLGDGKKEKLPDDLVVDEEESKGEVKDEL